MTYILQVLIHCCGVLIESLGKNFVTLVPKFFPSEFIGNNYRINMKKLCNFSTQFCIYNHQHCTV